LVSIYHIGDKNLADEAMAIYRRLKTGDLEAARSRLSGIVGRDTNNLDIEEISRATIETVAENTVDGILLNRCFFAFIGGAPLAMALRLQALWILWWAIKTKDICI